MKIKINEQESYEIKFQDEMSLQELEEFSHRINQILKMNQMSVMGYVKKLGQPRHYNKSGKYTNEAKGLSRKVGNKREWCNTKEKALELLKLQYFGEKEDKEKKAKEVGYSSWVEINKALHGLKKRYKIQPKEVGLKAFPPKTAGQLMRKMIPSLMLKNGRTKTKKKA